MLLRAALISQETSRSEQTYAPVHGPTPMPKGAELNVLGGGRGGDWERNVVKEIGEDLRQEASIWGRYDQMIYASLNVKWNVLRSEKKHKIPP